MQVSFVALLCCIAVAAGAAVGEGPVEPQLYYHENVGVPEAAAIREREEKLPAEDGSRIVGGSAAAAGAHPHLVSILTHRSHIFF